MKYTSEEDVLSSIDTFFKKSQRGDDCAMLNIGSSVISLDICSEDTDFRRSTFSPSDIGYKALAVNISDIFAMLAFPNSFMLGLVLPRSIHKDYLEEILSAMSLLAEKYNVALIGGDISTEAMLSFAITIFGKPVSTPALRGKASVGDVIFCISATPYPLGLARVGFDVLECHNTELLQQYPYAVEAQKKPALLSLEAIQNLAEFSSDISLMDISDGIAKDIPRLLRTAKTTLSAEIVLEKNIVHPEVLSWCNTHLYNPLEYAFIGGEEYALLGTCPPHLFESLSNSVEHCIQIGTVVQRSGIMLNNLLATTTGFDHIRHTAQAPI